MNYQKKRSSATSNDDFLVHWAQGTGTNFAKLKNKSGTWAEFCDLLSEPTRTKETRAQFDRLSKDEQDRLKSVDGWVCGAQHKDDRRNRANALPRDLLTLDMDSANPAMPDLMEAGLTGISCFEFLAHGTRRSTPEKPRLRLAIPLARKVSADEYGPLVRIVSWRLDGMNETIGQVDKVSARPAQMMFRPTLSADGVWFGLRNRGLLLDPNAQFEWFADAVGDWRDPANLPLFEGEETVREHKSKAEDPRAKKGLIGAFCRAYDVPDAIVKFELPYVPVDDHSAKPRYTYTGGTTTGGAVIEEGGLFLYSHHGSDPCADQLVNAFDLVREHSFGHLDQKIDREHTPVTQWPSYKAMIRLASEDEATLAEDAAERAEWTASFFPDLDDDVREEVDDLVGTKTGDPVVTRLNREHAVVVVRGKTVISTEKSDGSIDFGTARDLDTRYANDLVPVPGTDRREPASKRWLRDRGRRTYPGGIVMAPQGAPKGTLNLFRGWAAKPNPDGSCALFRRHVLEVLCDGNEDIARYVEAWLAHMVQRPNEKPGVALVLKGRKGTGKDTFAEYVAAMIGRRHSPTVANSEHLVGRFNSHIASALFLHVQEGSWAGDRKAEGVLKYLVTSPRVAIEPKGIDVFEVPSVLRLFISANARWVVPASEDERRWLVLNVNEAHRREEAYFGPLYAEMNGGGPDALLHYLQRFDLTGFNVREVPETTGLREQKLASLRDVPLWWFEVLSRGKSPARTFATEEESWSREPLIIERDGLRDAYSEFVRENRYQAEPLNSAAFGAEFHKLLPDLKSSRPRVNGERVWCYTLPKLSDARGAFEEWIGGPLAWGA